MATGIKKASFYISWYEVSLTRSDERALAFYKAIFNYYFYDKEPAPEDSIREAFLLIKPNIDKDMKNKRGGAPTGNSNARKQPHDLCFPLNSFDSTKQTDIDVDDDVEVEEEVEEDVDVLENSTRIPLNKGENSTRIPQEFHISNLEEFLRNYPVKLSKNLKRQIEIRLSVLGVKADYLCFCFEKVREKYPDSEHITGAFVSAVLEWDNLLGEYEERIESEQGSTA